jgi:hypothetical protein
MYVWGLKLKLKFHSIQIRKLDKFENIQIIKVKKALSAKRAVELSLSVLYGTVQTENREAILGIQEQRSRGEWWLLRGRRDGGGREGATAVVPSLLLCMCA